MRRIALVLGLATLFAHPALAQAGRKIRVDGIRPLAFGSLLAGAPTTVLRTDPANSGQFDLTAQNNDVVILSFSLPSSMSGPSGASLPLAFSGSDAGFSSSQSIGAQVAFDPRQSYVATMSQQGRGSVFLGGTVAPAFNQRPGSYSATITLTVMYP
ncbi:MAG TPA: DUF4402 domain-containing protein [Gemmatimonadales bacterium]|jgi:hypothetical protein|nr:DUF4402 domain-containing protein [Gemmatimonadales bacterium]